MKTETKATQKAQHTAGEWILSGSNKIRNGKDGFVIATITSDEITHFICNKAESEANAKLIAAAPEMLNLLQKLSNTITNGDDLESLFFETQNLINKATK